MENTKRYFSESSLARHLGTTRYRLQKAGLVPTVRSGIQKVFALDANDLERIEADFADSDSVILRRYQAASPAEQALMAADRQTFTILRNKLRPRLLAEHRASIKKNTTTN